MFEVRSQITDQWRELDYNTIDETDEKANKGSGAGYPFVYQKRCGSLALPPQIILTKLKPFPTNSVLGMYSLMNGIPSLDLFTIPSIQYLILTSARESTSRRKRQ